MALRTEKEIKEKLNAAKKELREVRAQFEKYDNHDDLEQIPVIQQEVDTLKWVLGTK
jgi:hypothetical protein